MNDRKAPTQLASPASSKSSPPPQALKIVETQDGVQLIDAKMIRVHIREGDNWNGEPLYEAILKCATEVASPARPWTRAFWGTAPIVRTSSGENGLPSGETIR